MIHYACRTADAVLLAHRRQLRRSPIRRPSHVRIKKASTSSLSTVLTPQHNTSERRFRLLKENAEGTYNSVARVPKNVPLRVRVPKNVLVRYSRN